MPETCENWLGLVNSCVYYVHQSETQEIYQVLLYSVDFKAPQELWNQQSKTVLSKYSFVWNKRPVYIQTDHKAQKQLLCRTCKYFF